MVIYSKLVKSPLPNAAVTTATGILSSITNVGSLKTEDSIVANNTIFYDRAGRIIPDLIYYDTNTNRGKRRLPNGELKECFIKKVRVSIGQFGINPQRKNDEVHLETIKEVVKSQVKGQAQAAMVQEIEERIKEKARQGGRPI